MKIKDIKKGEYLKLVNSLGQASKKVYIKDCYVREAKRYLIINAEDINEYKLVTPSREITTEFEY